MISLEEHHQHPHPHNPQRPLHPILHYTPTYLLKALLRPQGTTPTLNPLHSLPGIKNSRNLHRIQLTNPIIQCPEHHLILTTLLPPILETQTQVVGLTKRNYGDEGWRNFGHKKSA